MRLAITGSPGAGKTTLAGLLAELGRKVVAVDDWAREHDAVAGRDETDDADVIDVDALARAPLPDGIVIEGHLSHYLPVDEVWVVRCDPRILRQRLHDRGYPPAKVDENVEAEAMDLVLQEALASGARVVQRDGSRRSPQELLSAFDAIRPGAAKRHDLEPVDWSDALLE